MQTVQCILTALTLSVSVLTLFLGLRQVQIMEMQRKILLGQDDVAETERDNAKGEEVHSL